MLGHIMQFYIAIMIIESSAINGSVLISVSKALKALMKKR